jgi:hypothetical protein
MKAKTNPVENLIMAEKQKNAWSNQRVVVTPVARVIISVAAFALQRDQAYVTITLIVLAVPGYSSLGGVL